jgi:sulfate transport system ATP-binding protein
MSFLGAVTTLGGQLVRPHDIEVLGTPEPGSTPATITRVVRLGFEVRVEATIAEPDGSNQEVVVQLTRGEAAGLDLATGATVHLRPGSQARTLAVAAG